MQTNISKIIHGDVEQIIIFFSLNEHAVVLAIKYYTNYIEKP